MTGAGSGSGCGSLVSLNRVGNVGGDDHLAGGCTTPRCSNCEKPGHRVQVCPEPPLCGIYLASGHDIVDCPFLLFSGNVESETVSYAEVQTEAVTQDPKIQELKQDVERECRDREVRERELWVELREHNRERRWRKHRGWESCECPERKQSQERERQQNPSQESCERSRERKESRDHRSRSKSVGNRVSRSPPRRCWDRSFRSGPTRSPSSYSSSP